MSDDRFIFRDLYAEYHIRPDGTSWFSVPDYSVLPERALTAVTQRAEQMCSILKTCKIHLSLIRNSQSIDDH
jgi:hypothetical protein